MSPSEDEDFEALAGSRSGVFKHRDHRTGPRAPCAETAFASAACDAPADRGSYGALAEGREVGAGVVRGVMIPVGRGEDDAGAAGVPKVSAPDATRIRRPRPSRHRPASASHQRPSPR